MLSSFLLFIFLFVVWLLWVPAVVFSYAVEERKGGVSIVPVIPLYPIIAWGMAEWINSASEDDMGTKIIGGLHILLAVLFLIVIVKNLFLLRKKKII